MLAAIIAGKLVWFCTESVTASSVRRQCMVNVVENCTYRIAGYFHWYKFSYNLESFIKINFRVLIFDFFQVLQTTPPGTHVGLIRTFRLMVRASFTIKAMIHGYHILQGHLQRRNRRNVAVRKKIGYYRDLGQKVYVLIFAQFVRV